MLKSSYISSQEFIYCINVVNGYENINNKCSKIKNNNNNTEVVLPILAVYVYCTKAFLLFQNQNRKFCLKKIETIKRYYFTEIYVEFCSIYMYCICHQFTLPWKKNTQNKTIEHCAITIIITICHKLKIIPYRYKMFVRSATNSVDFAAQVDYGFLSVVTLCLIMIYVQMCMWSILDTQGQRAEPSTSSLNTYV